MSNQNSERPRIYHQTRWGHIILGNSLTYLREDVGVKSVDLIMTSPPFGLIRKKEYGNVNADEYVNWFRPFGEVFKKVLKDNGSLVIDIGGAWIPGQPTRSLYHFKLLIMLCEDMGFHLAQEFYWWNPSKLPTPAEWVNVRRVRVKDAVNCVWWLSPTPWPKANNRRILQPYSQSMQQLLKNGYKAMKRPSGHDISTKFNRDNGASIPPNLIALPNTESNSYYLRYCKEYGMKPHPARYPADLPEFFIRMLTNRGDLVADPFAGSCVTGEVCERLARKWVCADLDEGYLKAALGRFNRPPVVPLPNRDLADAGNYYKLPRPGLLWNGAEKESLAADGGRTRPKMPHKGLKPVDQRQGTAWSETKSSQLKLNIAEARARYGASPSGARRNGRAVRPKNASPLHRRASALLWHGESGGACLAAAPASRRHSHQKVVQTARVPRAGRKRGSVAAGNRKMKLLS